MSKEYIEKEALKAQFATDGWLKEKLRVQAYCTATRIGYVKERTVEQVIDSVFPADVKPVVKGKWLCEGTKCRIGYNDYEYWNKWRCSCCGYIRTEGWEHTSEGQEPKDSLICENCGAEMYNLVKNLKASAECADADTMMPAT